MYVYPLSFSNLRNGNVELLKNAKKKLPLTPISKVQNRIMCFCRCVPEQNLCQKTSNNLQTFEKCIKALRK